MTNEFIFDWFNDETPLNEHRNDDENAQNQTFAGMFKTNKQNTFAPSDYKGNSIAELSNENLYADNPTPTPSKITIIIKFY